MKIAITGSEGMLGSALCRHLGNNYDIAALSRKVCDLRNPDLIRRTISSIRPDALIHTAALTNVDHCQKHPDEAWAVNVKGTYHLADACRDTGVLFIYISTDYVFDGEKKSAYLETDIPNPLSIYAQTKHEAERIVSALLKKYFIVRVSWIFGKKGRDFVSNVFSMLEARKPLRIINDKFSNPTYNNDLAGAIETFLRTTGGYGVYHLTNQGGCSWFQWAQKILELSGKRVSIRAAKLKDFGFVAPRPKNTMLNCDKFRRLTGQRLRQWDLALEEYIQTWHRN